MKEKIIQYLKDTYDPFIIFVYGSYSRGDDDEFSDFDCTIVVDSCDEDYDHSIVDGVELDCLIFTLPEILNCNPILYARCRNAEIVFDKGIGDIILKKLDDYIKDHSETLPEKKNFIRIHTEKIIKRLERKATDETFRNLSYLISSLGDYCQLRDIFFFGNTKDVVYYLKKNDPEGHTLYFDALSKQNPESIKKWAEHVIDVDYI